MIRSANCDTWLIKGHVSYENFMWEIVAHIALFESAFDPIFRRVSTSKSTIAFFDLFGPDQGQHLAGRLHLAEILPVIVAPKVDELKSRAGNKML